MELAFITYLILQLDAISNTLSGVLAIMGLTSIFIAGAFLMVYLESDCEGKELLIKFSKVWFPIAILLLMINSLIPSSDNAKYILGAYGVQTAVSAVSENEDVKRIASKSLSVVESMLDKVSEQNKEKK